jgi:WD40 repeat protein
MKSAVSRGIRAAMGLAIVAVLPFATARSQLNPAASWQTIKTPHFFVHFTAATEAQARRAAVNAERAYAALASELHPPRGMIDLVITDDADFSNGSATPYPTNRIIIYANPPIEDSALRFTDDWNAMAITHELTHVFHLDRTRGWWAIAQKIFGRADIFFPNFNSPSWLTEGLAVHYESRFTGAGRIRGSEHAILARAALLDNRFPAINSFSLSNPRFPFGEASYAYGSLLVDYMARRYGEGKIRAFIEDQSWQPIPFLLDYSAKRTFGASWLRGWDEFRDSVRRDVGAPRAPIIGWRELTHDGVIVSFPRWAPDSSIVYTGTPGRESFGAYRVTTSGRRTRVGRRNSRTPNVHLPDGSLLFSQLEFTSPYEERSDLYIQRERRANALTWLHLQSRHVEQRLTVGARLSEPDARARDGAIVAVQTVPAASRLVRVSPDGKTITPITTGTMDLQWSEPRWSNAGDRIVAVRWMRGGLQDIVVLDTTGRILTSIARGHSVQSTPSWSSDDRAITYSSDRTGEPQLYLAALGSGGEPSERLLSSTATGLFEPELSRDSVLAAVLLRGDGYHLGVAPCCNATATTTLADGAVQASSMSLPPALSDSSPARRYSPWRTFWPRWWKPESDPGVLDHEYRIGFSTGGSDVIERHAFDLKVEIGTKNTGTVGSGSYSYAGLGLPILGVTALQDWTVLGDIVSRGTPQQTLGDLRRRVRSSDLTATWIRQRVRTALSFSLGAGVEYRDYATNPGGLLASIDSGGTFDPATFPRLLASAGWSNLQRPVYSISPEDGMTFAATARERLRSGFTANGPSSLSIVGVTTAFKSLDLPGFAHHVLALRAAGGWSDLRSNAYFEAGGVSGTQIELLPGYFIGETRQTFGVRGFLPGSLAGVRAIGGTVAYRAPLLMAGRGLSILPVFFDRASLELFAEGARAWCPTASADRQVCTTQSLTTQQTIASVGGEINLTTAIFAWEDPYRLRVGVAAPVKNSVGAPRQTLYFAAGFSF